MSDNRPPPDQRARDRAADPARSVLLQAPAGSGKTGVLLLRYLRCLMTVQRPEEVVAITFTKKAAAEIRVRVLEALRRAARHYRPQNRFEYDITAAAADVLVRDREQGWGLLDNPARLRVSTFDSFCHTLSRRLPLLSGLGATATSDDSEVLYRQAILSLFAELDDGDASAELRAALGRVLDYANNRIEQLIPLLANLLAKRDQWVQGVLGSDIDAMERALAAHVQQRCEECLRQLRQLNFQAVLDALQALSGESEPLAWAAELIPLEEMGAEQLPLLAQTADLLLTNGGTLIADRTAGPAKGFLPGRPETAFVKDWLKGMRGSLEGELYQAALGELRALPPPHLPAAARQLCADFALVLQQLLAHLRVVFEREGEVDFSEVAFRAISALSEPDEHGGLLGDAVLLEDRIQHILVDEMQDTSVNQIQLLHNLCQGWEPGDGRTLFFCGDLLQSIYLFRGALVGLFADLVERRQFAQRELELLQLTANFRSAPGVVSWVNDTFHTVFADSDVDFVAADAQRAVLGSVAVHGFIGDDASAIARAEAERVVQLIRRAQRADPEASIAVLVRSRAHLRAIVPALKAADIRFAGQDIDRLSESPAVVDFVALLRAWWHDADRVAWTGLLRAEFVGLGWDDIWLLCQCEGPLCDAVLNDCVDAELSGEGRQRLQRLRDIWRGIEAHPRSVDIRWALPALWYSLGGPACIAGHQQADIDRVLAIVAELSPGGYLADIGAFERAIDGLYAQPARARVELMTIHKAKGLEFDTVIVPGLGNQSGRSDAPLFYWRRLHNALVIAPRPQAEDPETERLYRYLGAAHSGDEKAEIDRLIYVALTRACRELHLLGGAVERDEVIRPHANSLLARLWPAVEALFTVNAEYVEADESEDTHIAPLAPRLSPDQRLAIQPFHRAAARDDDALERLAEQARQAVLDDNIEDRAVGIVYHELMRRIGAGHRRLLDDRTALTRAVEARLRHHCHPEQGLSESVQRVLRLADNTLDCEHGRWILAHYRTSGAEQAVRRKLGETWQRLIIDRFFVDGDTCWIIDYKTAEGGDAAFFAQQRERYAEKMRKYRDALLAVEGIDAVKTALYFPAARHLERVC